MRRVKFVVLALAGAAAFGAAWVAGWVPGLIAADRSYLSLIILALVVFSMGSLALGRGRLAMWIAQRLTMLGLLGTLIGLYIALSGVEWSGTLESDVAGAAAIIGGVGTAVSTTIFGLVGYLWLILVDRIVNAPDHGNGVS